jgi:hypothetical protein
LAFGLKKIRVEMCNGDFSAGDSRSEMSSSGFVASNVASGRRRSKHWSKDMDWFSMSGLGQSAIDVSFIGYLAGDVRSFA